MAKNYLLKSFADILAVNFLLHNQDLSGKFIQEKKSGNIWFKETKNNNFYNFFIKNRSDTNLYFEMGTPEYRSPEITWNEILTKTTIKSLDDNKISDEVIVITKDKNVLIEIIKKHYLIQMGEVSYSTNHTGLFYIKISYPSVWIISLIDKKSKIYNKVSGINNVYIEKGFEIKESYILQKNYNFKIPSNTYILINSDGSLENSSFIWKSANKDIEITGEKAIEYQTKENIIIEIEPKLVKSYNKKEAVLWKVDDSEKLKKILSSYSIDNLSGFKAWFLVNDDIYIFSKNSLNDSALISLFSDSFKSYTKLKGKAFFPLGFSLMPLLDENRLFEIYNVNNNDSMIFENQEDKITITVLSEKEAKPLSSFISYKVEKNITKIDFFESQWHFDFGDIKKKTPIIKIDEIKSDNLISYSNLKVRKGVKKEEDKTKNNIKRVIDAYEWERLKNEIYRIDNLLIDDINNSQLWLERSEISQELGNRNSAFISILISDIIQRDNKSFIDNIDDYIIKNESSDFLNTLKLYDEKSKGKILSYIRAKLSSAEINFSYQLFYAKKFHDKDVFNYAIDTMRKSYNCSSFKFHDFEEKSFSKDTTNLSIENKNIENINKNINQFVSILDNYDMSLKSVILKQFKIMLDSNLPFESNRLIELEEFKSDDDNQALKQSFNLINQYPTLPENPDKSTENWFSVLEMKNMKSIPIKDFFKGELYRSSFTSDFDYIELAKTIYEMYINNDENWTNILKAKKTKIDKAKSQRILLQIITDNSPLKDFKQFILEPVYDNSEYNVIVMNCDIYRINLRYGIKTDENYFFENLITSISKDYVSIVDFKDATENIIFCLFISQSARRKEFLNIILNLCLGWYKKIFHERTYIEELLTTITFLESAILLDDIPDSVTEYNFKARKNSLWTEYAVYLKDNFESFFFD